MSTAVRATRTIDVIPSDTNITPIREDYRFSNPNNNTDDSIRLFYKLEENSRKHMLSTPLGYHSDTLDILSVTSSDDCDNKPQNTYLTPIYVSPASGNPNEFVSFPDCSYANSGMASNNLQHGILKCMSCIDEDIGAKEHHKKHITFKTRSDEHLSAKYNL
jgi:hypothetical protein